MEVAGGDVGEVVELRVHRRRAERRAAGQHAALVGDRGHTGPERRRQAGASDLIPWGLGAEIERVVDSHAGIRVGIGGDVGDGAHPVVAGETVVLLVGRQRERQAVPTAAAVIGIAGNAPAGLAAPLVLAVEKQARAADRDDRRRGGRVLHPVTAPLSPDATKKLTPGWRPAPARGSCSPRSSRGSAGRSDPGASRS